ncbi:hypothetical protein [Lysobacter tyrosinilyticus]
MDKIVRAALLLAGTGLLTLSVVGLRNSQLDSRVLLTVAIGAAGMLVAFIGLRRWTAMSEGVR